MSAGRLVDSALSLVRSGSGRNNAGFSLAVQLRDNNYGEAEALAAMREFSRQAPSRNNKGEVEPYSEAEIKNSVTQAYSRSPRNPWNGSPGKRSQSKILPTVLVNNRELRDVSRDVLAALQAGNHPPILFVRGGRLVHVVSDENGTHSIAQVTEAALRGRMTRCADFRRGWKNRNGEKTLCSTNPPIDVVRDVMALTAIDWKFPPLEGLAASPILRPDGTILTEPGYDPATQVVYAPPTGFSLPRIADDPSTEDILDSVALIDEVLEGFPFTDWASRANAIAMLITPLIRRAVQGNVPIALVDAPQAGTGKSLLAEVVSIVHTGANACMKPSPRDEEEFRKALGAILLAGNGLTIFDNVTHRLDSASLALAVTASTWTDRALGESRMLTLPQRTTWLVTGNNLTLGGDLPRRCFWIRLDAATSQPWERTGFRHPDLKTWVRENRGRLLAALLTMCRAWFCRGKPSASGPVLGSFESWCQTIGGILSVAGIEGFLQNRDDLYQQADPSQEQWEAFLQVIRDYFDGDSFTTNTLVEKMRTEPAIQPAIPDEFADEDRRGNLQRRLGRAFRERLGRRYGAGGLRIVKAGLTRNKVVQWSVRGQ